jgi:hypothetical protein
LRDLPQHQVVGRGPGVAPGLSGRFLAAEPQRALLVVVIDVPNPGDRGAAAADLGGEIAAHAVAGRAFAGDDRQVAKLGFAVEHVHHPVEHLRRRAIDRFERDRRAATGHGERAAAGATAAGAAAERARDCEQQNRCRAPCCRNNREQDGDGVPHHAERYR